MVELLVAVAIIGLAVLSGTGIFFSSLKSKRKSESLAEIKQKGSYSLQVISTKIRSAKKIDLCDLNKGANNTDTIRISNYDNSTNAFSCDPTNKMITFDSNKLVSNYVISCDFACNLSVKPPIITIDFTLQKGQASDMLGYANQQFSRIVSLRTY